MMIETQRLEEFVNEVMEIRRDETLEKTRWEYWLHKDFVRSWPDYLAALNDNSSTNAAPTQDELKQTVSESAAMLMNFRPDSGGEQDGTVQTIGDDSG